MSTESTDESRGWGVASVLFVLTLVSTHYVGAMAALGEVRRASDLVHGASFAVPLMSILLAHELGHYVAARVHRVPVSPPYFLPVPMTLLGTMGAVIHMKGRIRTRAALMDVGASGPLAGMAIAVPVLVYGIVQSPVRPVDPSVPMLLEGRSLLYVGLLRLLKGPIPDGYDIFLSPTAFAGWAGLLVTMINLLPIGQLDGGHVAYALLGRRQDLLSTRLFRALPFIAALVGAFEAARSMARHAPWSEVNDAALLGMPWLVWFGMVALMRRMSGVEHPPTDDDSLDETRRRIARFTLALFPLLFMPWWMR